MITVVSVLKTGKFQGREYTPAAVHRLKAMVKANLRMYHRFVCFSDADIPDIEVFPLREDWPGWWSKLEMFRWNADTRLLYLDLDVLVAGPLDDLVTFPAPMVLAKCIVTKPKPKLVRRYQSSVMAWTPPEGREIYSKFRPDRHMYEFRGDQDWIGYIKPDCATYPSEWFCKLRHRGDQPRKGVKVVLNYKEVGIGIETEPCVPQEPGADLERVSP